MAGEVYRVTIEGTLLGQVVNNVMHFGTQDTDVTAPGDAAAVAADAAAAWATNMMPILSTAYVLTGVTATPIFSGGSTGEAAVAASGGNTDAAYTGLACAKVSLRTALRGRAFRGRTGIAGLTEGQVAGNTIVESTRAAIQTNFANFVGAMNVATGPGYVSLSLGVLSTRFAGGPRVPPIFTEVTSFSVASTIGSRESRLR